MVFASPVDEGFLRLSVGAGYVNRQTDFNCAEPIDWTLYIHSIEPILP